MGDNKGEITKKQSQQEHLTQPPSPKDNVPVQESSTEEKTTNVSGSVPPILFVPPPPLYISSDGGGEGVNPKRPRFSSTTGQWKLHSPQTQQQKQHIQINIIGTELTHLLQPNPSPTYNHQHHHLTAQPAAVIIRHSFIPISPFCFRLRLHQQGKHRAAAVSPTTVKNRKTREPMRCYG